MLVIGVEGAGISTYNGQGLTSDSQIGTGIGRTLFNHAMATAKQLGATEIEIEAEPNAIGFYERMGATRVGQNEYELEGQPRILPLLIYKLA